MTQYVHEHYDDLEKQAHAARLGMWVFLASEVLLFAGLFVLYAAYRAHYPRAFAEGVQHNPRVMGSINTLVLLTSSFFVALAVDAVRRARRVRAVALLGATVAAAIAFLAIKLTEYGMHFHEGIFPGASGRYFREHGAEVGLGPFYTLYFLMTGLHAIHVVVGTGVVSWAALGVMRGRINEVRAHPMEVAALYWHLVDAIWIFLWPCFYLLAGSR